MKILPLIIGLALFLVYSCKERKREYAWQYPDGRKVYIISSEYAVTDTLIKQKFFYESSWEYFEVNLKTMTGKYLTWRIFAQDSVLRVSRIYLDSLPKSLETYKLALGYDDYIYDNEVDFYLKKKSGVFMVRNPNNHSIRRILVPITVK